MSERLAILAEGLFADFHAKTAHGVIRYGQREVVAVVDSTQSGRTADAVVGFCARPVPIVASIAEAAALGAQVLLLGVAPLGGKLTPQWRTALGEALAAGLHVEAGLHTQIAEDPELREAAERRGLELRDLRRAPSDLDVPPPLEARPQGIGVVHSVGSDCAIGKKAVTLELDREARERGLASAFVPTGQTGIAIAGWGIAVDHVLADYVAGAGARLVAEGAERLSGGATDRSAADRPHRGLLFVEGQGALFHPAYSGVTLGLLHGVAPDVLVLAHEAGAVAVADYPRVPLPALGDLVAAYEAVSAPVKPARVAAVALNTGGLEAEDAEAACAAAGEATGLVADDPVRFGAGRLLDAVLAALPRPA